VEFYLIFISKDKSFLEKFVLIDMEQKRNVDVAFTNDPGSTNFKKKNEDNLMKEIEPETSLGFISNNRNADISDLFYTQDALQNDRNIEETMRAQEEEELARFRVSSIYRPVTLAQKSAFHLKKKEIEESKKSAKIVFQKKKRKISDVVDKVSTVVTITAPNEKPSTAGLEDQDVAIPVPSSNALSNLLGAYDEDSD